MCVGYFHIFSEGGGLDLTFPLSMSEYCQPYRKGSVRYFVEKILLDVYLSEKSPKLIIALGWGIPHIKDLLSTIMWGRSRFMSCVSGEEPAVDILDNRNVYI